MSTGSVLGPGGSRLPEYGVQARGASGSWSGTAVVIYRTRLLDARATDITDEMLVAAARAIADVVSPDQPNASYIVRSVLDERVSHAVSRAVVAASPSRLHPAGGAKESAMR